MKKKFEDLKFKTHPSGDGKMARLFFENGYGISVVRFKMPSFFHGGMYGSYTNNEDEWEIAVLRGNEEKSELTYDTPITNDVIGHLSASEVTDIMCQIQDLPSCLIES